MHTNWKDKLESWGWEFKCSRCGNQRGLLFHHKDLETKVFEISSFTNNAKITPEAETLLKIELEKCEILCSSCQTSQHVSERAHGEEDVTPHNTLRHNIDATNVTDIVPRQEGQRGWTAEIREWVEAASGNFSTAQLDRELEITAKADKAKRRVILSRFVGEGLVKRHPTRNGVFKRVEVELVRMDITKDVGPGEDITFPFGLNEMVKLYSGNIAVIAGEKSAGKTAFCLNLMADNLHKSKIHYFNSEMGEEELSLRLRAFPDMDYKDFHKYCKMYERSHDFADVIEPGKGNINIIDYMSIYENAYLIGQWIKDVHDALEGAIAIIAIQKPPGRDMGIGGYVTQEIARLYLAMSPGRLKIVNAKNRKKPGVNPDGMIVNFSLVGGCQFIQKDAWSMPEETDG